MTVVDARVWAAPQRRRSWRTLWRQSDEEAQDRLEVQRAWFEAGLAGWPGWSGVTPQLAQRVPTAKKCMELNAQKIAGLELKFASTAPAGGREPSWLGNPDPVWFPNGIRSAVYAAVWHMYAYGDAFLYVTSRYADGYPSSWTVLDSSTVTVGVEGGRRAYRVSEQTLNPDDVVQVTRNPQGGLRGTAALSGYEPYALGLISGAQAAASLAENPIPNAILKSEVKLDREQAEALQAQWVERSGLRRGAPAILPPKLDFEVLQYSPQDLLLLDSQKFCVQMIAQAYGVPAMALNMALEGSLVYQNPQGLDEFWWRDELQWTAKALSDALSLQMLPAGNEVYFDASQLYGPLAAPMAVPPTPVGAAAPSDQPTTVVPLRPAQEGF